MLQFATGLRNAQFIVAREGRDQGGVFLLTEMPAVPATEWFLRAMQLLVRSGVDVPPSILQQGVVGFVTLGVGALLTGLGKSPWGEIKSLLDELLTCVTSYQPPNGTTPLVRWEVIKTQISEPATILQLYEEVVSLHLGFSLAARLLTYRTYVTSLIDALGPSTATSTQSSDTSSPPA